jgi:hypothetical protein
MGLSITITKALVERHCGTLGIESGLERVPSCVLGCRLLPYGWILQSSRVVPAAWP